MNAIRFNDQFLALFDVALHLTNSTEADAIVLLLEGAADWQRLLKLAGNVKVVVAADAAEKAPIGPLAYLAMSPFLPKAKS